MTLVLVFVILGVMLAVGSVVVSVGNVAVV